ncbi:hypothetical protein ANACOL_01067 [Anaerotruncus colihominis DSM 17241]|uniref:Uncharacterized protein n=1 Tax=Anaerotruncus colihominis DSM 17241 TaxID=445972 RepID=B0P8H9_9FIRM|nr:hypothetical protein ANACOL_01067 [Anaerotruncus colihominis DSM 17241]
MTVDSIRKISFAMLCFPLIIMEIFLDTVRACRWIFYPEVMESSHS